MDVSKKNTFGRSLKQYLASALPYQSPQSIMDDVQAHNPKYRNFFDVGSYRDEILSKHSITSTPSVDDSQVPLGGFLADAAYSQLMYATIDENKYRRIRDYRVMAAFAEMGNALDEICDEFINPDEEGDIINLNFRKAFDIDTESQDKMNEEFEKFINHYELPKKGWEMVRNLLVDGELYFENIIHEDHIDKGILGLIDIPTESIDPVYDNYKNMAVKAFMLRKSADDVRAENDGDAAGKSLINRQDQVLIPLDKNQVTYINSGIWDEGHLIRQPFIERARRPYRLLTLIEDSIVIYRLARAPEKLVFNVEIGEMSTPQSEGYIRKLMSRYWSKQTYNIDDNQRVKAFNPQSILDAYWFPKRDGKGTTVETLPGGQNLGQLEDLFYFVKKLYESLKVPSNRIDPQSNYSPDATVLREELKFANFIVRLQQQFACGLKDAFITHLKLRGIWKKGNLRENAFDIVFNPPQNYFELRQQQVRDLKFNNFNAMAGNDSISPSYAQQEYLGWSDDKIKANRAWLRKDARLRRELGQIEGAIDGAGMPGTGDPLGALAGEEGDTPPEFGPMGGLDQAQDAEAEAPPTEEPAQ